MKKNGFSLFLAFLIFIVSSSVFADFPEAVEAYEKGNFSKAYQLFLIYAQEGLASAQYNVGCLFHNGEGVEQNFSEALKWYRLAEKNGHQKAKENIAQIEKFLEEEKKMVQNAPPGPDENRKTPLASSSQEKEESEQTEKENIEKAEKEMKAIFDEVLAPDRKGSAQRLLQLSGWEKKMIPNNFGQVNTLRSGLETIQLMGKGERRDKILARLKKFFMETDREKNSGMFSEPDAEIVLKEKQLFPSQPNYFREYVQYGFYERIFYACDEKSQKEIMQIVFQILKQGR